MGRVIMKLWQRLEQWVWHWEIRRREREIQRHFRDVAPDSVVDIDKYLRAHGLLP